MFQKLFRAARVDKIQSEFEMVRLRFVSYLEEMFNKGLQPPHVQTFHEIVFFSDVASLKNQILGSPRGALHMALSNPTHYLHVSVIKVLKSTKLLNTKIIIIFVLLFPFSRTI